MFKPTMGRNTEPYFIVTYGCGSKLNSGGYAGVGPGFHLPGFHFGTGFLGHSHIFHQCLLLDSLRRVHLRRESPLRLQEESAQQVPNWWNPVW